MKLTLLDMVQNILSSMDSDEVNSISDTPEASQVAAVIVEVFYEQFLNRKLPEQEGLIHLDSSGDPSKPTHMKISADTNRIKWIKYDTLINGLGSYSDVVYKTPEEFLFTMTASRPDSSHSQTGPGPGGTTLIIINNKNPQFWTSFNDSDIIFDSFDNSLDSTLQSSKTLCWGNQDPEFTMSDTSIPPIDSMFFPLLLAEAKSKCWFNFKGQTNSKEEQVSRRQKAETQKYIWKADQRRQSDGGYDMPDYGRRSR